MEWPFDLAEVPLSLITPDGLSAVEALGELDRQFARDLQYDPFLFPAFRYLDAGQTLDDDATFYFAKQVVCRALVARGEFSVAMKLTLLREVENALESCNHARLFELLEEETFVEREVTSTFAVLKDFEDILNPRLENVIESLSAAKSVEIPRRMADVTLTSRQDTDADSSAADDDDENITQGPPPVTSAIHNDMEWPFDLAEVPLSLSTPDRWSAVEALGVLDRQFATELEFDPFLLPVFQCLEAEQNVDDRTFHCAKQVVCRALVVRGEFAVAMKLTLWTEVEKALKSDNEARLHELLEDEEFVEKEVNGTYAVLKEFENIMKPGLEIVIESLSAIKSAQIPRSKADVVTSREDADTDSETADDDESTTQDPPHVTGVSR